MSAYVDQNLETYTLGIELTMCQSMLAVSTRPLLSTSHDTAHHPLNDKGHILHIPRKAILQSSSPL
jgi:hypothetical protein